MQAAGQRGERTASPTIPGTHESGLLPLPRHRRGPDRLRLRGRPLERSRGRRNGGPPDRQPRELLVSALLPRRSMDRVHLDRRGPSGDLRHAGRRRQAQARHLPRQHDRMGGRLERGRQRDSLPRQSRRMVPERDAPLRRLAGGVASRAAARTREEHRARRTRSDRHRPERLGSGALEALPRRHVG